MSAGIKLRYFPFSELRLEPNPRTRESITEAEIDETAESVLQHGIIQPALARMRDGHPHIYAGQCRYLGFERALQRAKSGEECPADLTEFPVLIRDIDDRTMRVHQWIENLQRKGVHPRDEVRGYAELRDQYGMTLVEISHKIGKGENYVVNRMVLLDLPDLLWKAFDEKRITISHLEVAGSIPHLKDREEFGKLVIGGRYGNRAMTVKEAQELKNSDFVRAMRACGFDKTDATLVAVEHKDGVRIIGGACVADVANCEYLAGKVKSQQCTNVRCFHAKQDAAWRVITQNAAGTGRRTMDVDQTAALFDDTGELLESSGFVDLGGAPLHLETGHHNEDDTPPWDELLEGTEAAALAVMARHPRTNRVHQLLEREDAIRLAVENDPKHAKIFENRPGAKKPRPGDKLTGSGGGVALEEPKDEGGDEEETEVENFEQGDVWAERCQVMSALYDELMSARGVRVLTAATWKLAVMEACVNASPLLMGHVLGLESHPRWEKSVKWQLVAEHLRAMPMTTDQAQALVLLSIVAQQLVAEDNDELVEDLKKRLPKKSVKTVEKPAEQLFDCPECGGKNFTKKGLTAHNCERRKERGLLTMDCDAAAFYESLMQVEIPKMKHNANGVFEQPVLFKRRFGKACSFAIFLAMNDDGWLSASTEYTAHNASGGALPNEGHRYDGKFAALKEMLHELRHQVGRATVGTSSVADHKKMKDFIKEVNRLLLSGEMKRVAAKASDGPNCVPHGKPLGKCELCQAQAKSKAAKPTKAAKKRHGGVPEVDPKVKAKARKLYDAGKGKDAIAKELGISPNTVGNWQKRDWPKRGAKK